MENVIPDLYLFIGGTHVHHLNYGIFLLAGVGCYFVFSKPTAKELKAATIIYAIGLALTFDEFGMWLHLGGGYWQRASFDAITIIAAFLSMIAFYPPIRSWKSHHYLFIVSMGLVIVLFLVLLVSSVHLVEKKLKNKFKKPEANETSLTRS